ncbi:glycosyltransferase family 2 protein [Actinoplanes sp. NPDC023801]|uniref:glycosyltransferase family 2 protein n=1 Tax=Actinoplanes sp. NPDC023801 TaxID=3154595 RepID=UPI0033E7D881
MRQVHPYSRTIVLLPAYRPGPRLTELIMELLSEVPAASQIVIVDDGNDPACSQLRAAEALGCTVLRHSINLGKGAALKTGLEYVCATHPGFDVVCADTDGQHRASDIRLVAERLDTGRVVLGVRDTRQMPPRSRFGNTLTRWLFRAATGREVDDTQTGLRGLPAGLLDRLCAIPGDGFEYEMNVLLDAAESDLPIEQVSVPVRYLDGNAASNFQGITDSVRVYRPLVKFVTRSRRREGSAPAGVSDR